MKGLPPATSAPEGPLQPQWQPLIDSLLEAVCLVEPRGLRIVAVNGAAARLLGVEREGLIGRPVIELAVTPDDEWQWEEIAAGAGGAHRQSRVDAPWAGDLRARAARSGRAARARRSPAQGASTRD